MNVRSTAMRIAQVFVAAYVLGAPFASAQQTTEQYIPIGQSPGVSGVASYVGRVIAIDPDRHTISVDARRAVHLIRVAETTLIWLDRSKVGRENAIGSYDDCKVGVRVEIMPAANGETIASWIKIEAP